MFTIPANCIKVEKGHNPRNYDLPENRAHLDELKASIRHVGTQVPLLVRFDTGTGQAILVDGECRLRANLELINEGCDIRGVPVIQVPGGNEADRLVLALTANTGKPLSKWEIGAAFQRLINFGWSNDDIAAKMGYAKRYVTEALELSDAPMEIKSLLSQQAVTPSLAISEIRKNGSGAVLTLRAAAESAKPGRNGHKIARRAVTVKRYSFTEEEVKSLWSACNQADDDPREAALSILQSKGFVVK